MKSLISFIMPTYNRAYIIREAVESILAQTYSDWELVIVDDGSTDRTKELFEGIGDPRIRYYNQENKGPAAARNKALKLVKGDWIAYLDSDNTLFPNFLEVMLKRTAERGGVVFAFPKGHRFLELYKGGKLLQRINNTEKEFGGDFVAKDIAHRTLHTDASGSMHSRKVIKEGIRWDEGMGKMEDWEFFLQLSEKYPSGFLYVSELLYTYTQRFGGDGLVSNSTYGDWAGIFEYIYQKHKNDRLMEGQNWYPEKMEKWRKLEAEYRQGLIPAYPLWYFKEHWDK